jgi:hypothetical protein
MRTLAFVFCVAVGATFATAATQGGFVAEDPANEQWNVSAKSNDAIWLGGHEKTALLALKKSVLSSGHLEIETDAPRATFRTSDGRAVTVPVTAGKVTRLSFEVADERPLLKVNDQELPAARGPWIALSLDKSEKRLLELSPATYATVRYLAPGSSAAEAAAASTRPVDAPPVKISKRTSAAQLTAAAQAIPNAMQRKCKPCNGTGVITVQVQTGTRQEGGLDRPTFGSREKQCESCDGKKVQRATDQALARLADMLVTSIATLNPEDAKGQAALTEAFAVLTGKVIADEPTWVMLNTRGRGTVAQRLIESGTPIIVQARFFRSIPGAVDTERQFVGVVSGTDQTIVLRKPITAEETPVDSLILMGGLVAGVSQSREGERVVLMEHGFLVAPNIPRDWTWWWGNTLRRVVPR